MSKTNEDVLKEILEQSLAGYWDWDIPTGNEYLSPSFKQMFGYNDHELENRADSWQKLIFQEDLPGVYEKFNKHEESKGTIPFYNEIRYHHKNGSTVWVICTGKVIEWNENGKAKRMVGCHIDITQRKKAEEARLESEERFHALFEKAPLGYQSLDRDGVFIEVNQAWLETLGYKREEVLGKWFGDFLAPEYVQAFRERFPIFKDQGKIHSEFYMLHKDGSRRYITFDGRIAHNADGTFKQTHCILKDETGRKQAEEALKRSNDLLSETEIIGKVGGWSFNIDTLEQTWTDEVYRIHEVEISPNPSVEKGINFYTAKSRPIIEKAVQRAIEFGEEFDLELEIITAKGNPRTVHTIGKSDLKNRRIYGFFQDITQRKQAEEALRESEGIFNQFMSNSPAHIYIKDEKLRLLKVSDSFKNLLGKPISELLGKDSFELLPPEFAQNAIADDQKTLREGITVKTEETLNGRVYATIKFPIRRESGKIDYLGGFSIDITEQKHAERDHLMLSTLVHNSTSMFVVKDLRFRIITANKAFIQATGRNNISELIGKTDAEIIGLPEDSEPFISYRLDDIKAAELPLGERLSREETVPVPTQGNRTFLTQKFPIRNESNKVIGIGVISTDITELKENEAIREKFNDKMNQMQKLESLGVLAGGIAHDFNNLMGGIFGYIDLANYEPDKAQSSQYLSKAMSTIDRARALTQQLLTFAKGGAPIKKIDNLFPFVEETAKFALSGANVSCNFDVVQDLWACNFDKNQIGQVIDNLIINAQQAMPVGGTIELSAQNITLTEKEHPLLKNGKYVKISVKDSGIGIPKELIARIFNPFFTTKPKGHGLGLATCYSIIKRHDGCIDVESESGRGSTFKVYLPATAAGASVVAGNTVPEHKGSGTILIMDDEEVMRETIGRILETFGYTLVGKENGRETIDFFAAETGAGRAIAGMILDLTVPGGMGGREAIAEIRKLNAGADIPAFVASGYGDDPVMINPAEYGFTASICKPFMKSELSEMLNKYMTPKQ